jgi:hypothetical protein
MAIHKFCFAVLARTIDWTNTLRGAMVGTYLAWGWIMTTRLGLLAILALAACNQDRAIGPDDRRDAGHAADGSPPGTGCAVAEQTLVATDGYCYDPSIALGREGPRLAWSSGRGEYATRNSDGSWTVQADVFGPDAYYIHLAVREDGSPVALLGTPANTVFLWTGPATTRTPLPGPQHLARWLAGSRSLAVAPEGRIETLVSYYDETPMDFRAVRGADHGHGLPEALSVAEITRSDPDDTSASAGATDVFVAPNGTTYLLFAKGGKSWLQADGQPAEELPASMGGAGYLAMDAQGILHVMSRRETADTLIGSRRAAGEPWEVNTIATGQTWDSVCAAAVPNPGKGDRCVVDAVTHPNGALVTRPGHSPVVVLLAVEEKGELTWTCGGNQCDLPECCTWSPLPQERFVLMAAPLGQPLREVAELPAAAALSDGSGSWARVGLSVVGAADGSAHIGVVERIRDGTTGCHVSYLKLACE